MSKTIRCPNCDAPLAADPSRPTLRCDYCKLDVTNPGHGAKIAGAQPGKSKAGLIIGIAVGGVALMAIIPALFLFRSAEPPPVSAPATHPTPSRAPLKAPVVKPPPGPRVERALGTEDLTGDGVADLAFSSRGPSKPGGLEENGVGLIDGKNGKLAWHKTYLTNSRARSASATCHDVLVVQDNTRSIVAYEGQSGAQRWRLTLSDFVRNYQSRPAGTKERPVCLFGTVDKAISAVDVKAGKLLWRKEATSPWALRNVQANDDTVQFMGPHRDPRFALDLFSGEERRTGIVARRLDAVFPDLNLSARADKLKNPGSNVIQIAGATRMPYFCSGCPHNTSTRVPEGSEALAGIGCHFMASWMDRQTEGLIQMGGEGVNWIPRSRFNGGRHVFQNLGDGTWYHSGSTAIRQAVAADTNITFKILFNDAVAMTGGQPVDGPITVPAIAHSVRAEGVERIAIVSDEPDNFDSADFPQGTTISHRRSLDAVQRELRDIPGVTVLIYAQACATEKRRRRKRGTLEDPNTFVMINDLVCEGCGDCSVESNCLSVVPKETPFGRKRQIDQSSCNKDYSCVNGFCPSFVTVVGGEPQRRDGKGSANVLDAALAGLRDPEPTDLSDGFDLLVTGIGGTGVVTVGQLVTMAAHLEGKGASVLDFMGFAQKFGTVVSFIRLGDQPANINQVRIEQSSADALIGCDIVVSSSPRASSRFRKDHTRAMLNIAEMPTADFVQYRDASLRVDDRVKAIRDVVGEDRVDTLDANALAAKLLGNTIFANVLLLGAAWQRGLVPIGLDALLRAIELNGVEIEKNKQAFGWGRLAAADLEQVLELADGKAPPAETLEQTIDRRAAFLVDYQNQALADRYTALLERVRGVTRESSFIEAVAKSYFKLLSYKDEYEVARLHTGTGFLESVREAYGDNAQLRFHLAPPLLSRGKDARGRPLKKTFGAWLRIPMRLLASMRGLRGTPFDPFGRTSERRMERALIVEFEDLIDDLLPRLNDDSLSEAADLIGLYMDIRGYGPVKEEAVDDVRARVAAHAMMRG